MFSSIKAYISELENLVESQEYDDLFRLKRYAYIYAYESRYFEEMQNLFPDIRRRLFGGVILTDIVLTPNCLVA